MLAVGVPWFSLHCHRETAMLQSLPAPSHVLAVQLSGDLSGDDVRQYKALLHTHVQQQERLGLLIDMSDLNDMAMGTLAPGVRADLDLLKHASQFDRLALVSDKHWPGLLLRMAGPWLHGMQLRQFASAEREQALQWVAEAAVEQTVVVLPPALRLIPTTSEGLLAFEIDGPISRASIASVLPQIQAFLDRHEHIDVLAHFKHFGGIEPALYLQPGLLQMKFKAIPKVARYALVAAPGWMDTLAHTLRPLLGDMQLRSFTESELAQAWEWLAAQPR